MSQHDSSHGKEVVVKFTHFFYFTVLGSSKKTLNASGSISSSTQSIHSVGSMPGDMSQVDGRVGRWALGFDKLMEDPGGLGCFKVFESKIKFILVGDVIVYTV